MPSAAASWQVQHLKRKSLQQISWIIGRNQDPIKVYSLLRHRYCIYTTTSPPWGSAVIPLVVLIDVIFIINKSKTSPCRVTRHTNHSFKLVIAMRDARASRINTDRLGTKTIPVPSRENQGVNSKVRSDLAKARKQQPILVPVRPHIGLVISPTFSARARKEVIVPGNILNGTPVKTTNGREWCFRVIQSLSQSPTPSCSWS